MDNVSSRAFAQGGTSLWKWDAGQKTWSKIKDESKPGFRTGAPPPSGYAGKFDGDLRAVLSVPGGAP